MDVTGRSFIAALHCATPRKTAVVDYVRSAEIAGDGWLVQGRESQHELLLRFDYLFHSENRAHFNISGARTAGKFAQAKLGVSLNGFLGLYHTASVTDEWKLEIVSGSDVTGRFEFYLRDHRGYRVGSVELPRPEPFFQPNPGHFSNTLNYLSVEEGVVARFTATITQFV